jgi:hypothetical protein
VARVTLGQAILRVLAMTWSKLSCSPSCCHQRDSQRWHEPKCTWEPSVRVIAIEVTGVAPQNLHRASDRASGVASEAGPDSWVPDWRGLRGAIFGTADSSASGLVGKITRVGGA